MNIPLPQTGKRYTILDYLSWTDDERWELIDGVAYNMGPAPNLKHQQISFNITLTLGAKLKNHPCRLFYAPTDVALSESDVVQPDVFVVCDPKKMEGQYIDGAPDVIFEILSPASLRRDRIDKMALYAKYGVKDYLLVDLNNKAIERYALADGSYETAEIAMTSDEVTLPSLEMMKLPVWELFGLEQSTERNAKE